MVGNGQETKEGLWLGMDVCSQRRTWKTWRENKDGIISGQERRGL